jgi:putative ABC transport system substrate-binding protein
MIGAVLLAPMIAFAQSTPRVIGWLVRDKPMNALDTQQEDGFSAGMRERGYTEGRDYRLERRFAGGDLKRLEAMGADLIAQKVDLILVFTTDATRAARKATRTLPIVAVIGDPVSGGFAASLSRPGGNVTGIATLSTTDLTIKRLDVLRQIQPGVRRVGYLYNPDYASDRFGLKLFENACSELHLSAIPAAVKTEEEVAAVFQALRQKKAQGVLTTSTSVFHMRRTIIEHAAKDHLPVVYGRAGYAEAGGLVAYGADYPDTYRRIAGYVDRIFKGANPAELPIEQPSKFELVVNLKAAKAAGIKIPRSILQRADRVIE